MRNVFLIDEPFLTRIAQLRKEEMVKYNEKRYSRLV